MLCRLLAFVLLSTALITPNALHAISSPNQVAVPGAVGHTLTLPTQDQVFAVEADECSDEGPYFSSDEFFSALPSLRPMKQGPVPLTRHPNYQSGVLVTKDKRVFFLSSYRKGYVHIWEAGSKEVHHDYAFPARISQLREAPRFDGAVSTTTLPKQEDVFVIATFPWNKETAFTPDSLFKALPQFDVVDTIRYEDGLTGEALNGVIVLKNRGILKWYTRLPTWLSFRCDPSEEELAGGASFSPPRPTVFRLSK